LRAHDQTPYRHSKGQRPFQYDLGYLDNETCRLEPNAFETRVISTPSFHAMSASRSPTLSESTPPLTAVNRAA
jgi:hypothetical protein